MPSVAAKPPASAPLNTCSDAALNAGSEPPNTEMLLRLMRSGHRSQADAELKAIGVTRLGHRIRVLSELEERALAESGSRAADLAQPLDQVVEATLRPRVVSVSLVSPAPSSSKWRNDVDDDSDDASDAVGEALGLAEDLTMC